MMGMLPRAVAAAVLMIGVSMAVQRAAGADSVPPYAPLSTLPLAMDGWTGRELPAWDDRVMSVLGVDDYINRRYATRTAIADLYVGYYRSQRQGDSIHSPQNCLPGAGWQPVSNERVSLEVGGGRTIPVNRYVIQKELDRQVVLYWFQGRGRAVASEYANRAYLVFDSLTTRRSDGALVRVISPAFGSVDEAGKAAASFARAMYPRLSEVVP
jgi:EpsI family protein